MFLAWLDNPEERYDHTTEEMVAIRPSTSLLGRSLDAPVDGIAMPVECRSRLAAFIRSLPFGLRSIYNLLFVYAGVHSNP